MYASMADIHHIEAMLAFTVYSSAVLAACPKMSKQASVPASK